MLLLTDDGQLVHRINTPKKGIWKVMVAERVHERDLLDNILAVTLLETVATTVIY